LLKLTFESFKIGSMQEQERNPIARLSDPTVPEEVRKEQEQDAEAEEAEQESNENQGSQDEGGSSGAGDVAADIAARKVLKGLLSPKDKGEQS
jgi:hypothetical protein